MNTSGKIRVLVVDDSAIARDFLERGLASDSTIEVIGKASDAYSARDRIVLLHPDVITLDIEMPGMDGIEFLKRLIPQYPIPVVVVSAYTVEGSRRALEALMAGAVDVVAKPDARDKNGLTVMIADLAERVKEASAANMHKLLLHRGEGSIPCAQKKMLHTGTISATNDKRIIAIGASTGGTTVLNTIVPQFPSDMPGVVIVQHMPPGFTRMFADSLNKASCVHVKEAQTGDIVHPGLVLVAPGGLQTTVHRRGTDWIVECKKGEKISGHCPSVDVLFGSVATAAGERATGLLLTGMGKDGADGMLQMRRNGARCFAQDEASSIVFGMPKEAWENGSAERLVSIEQATATLVAASNVHAKAWSN